MRKTTPLPHTPLPPKIFLEMDCLLKLVEPTKTLVLTFDGPAPFAKLQTQRSRRITSPQNCLITPGKNNNIIAAI